MLEKLGEMPLRIAAKIFGKWILGKGSVPMSLPVNVNPNDAWLSSNAVDWVNISRVMDNTADVLKAPRVIPGVVTITARMRQVHAIWMEGMRFRVGASLTARISQPVLFIAPASAESLTVGRWLGRGARLVRGAGWANLGISTIQAIYEAYGECDQHCRTFETEGDLIEQ